MDNVVTIFTDASFTPRRSGCGYYIRHDEAALRGSEGFDAANNNEAELEACLRGLAFAVRELGSSDLIFVLQSDSTHALGVLFTLGVGKPAKTSPLPISKVTPNARQQAAVQRFLNEYGELQVWLKHVRGHQYSTRDSRSYVNNLVDRLAREGRSK